MRLDRRLDLGFECEPDAGQDSRLETGLDLGLVRALQPISKTYFTPADPGLDHQGVPGLASRLDPRLDYRLDYRLAYGLDAQLELGLDLGFDRRLDRRLDARLDLELEPGFQLTLRTYRTPFCIAYTSIAAGSNLIHDGISGVKLNSNPDLIPDLTLDLIPDLNVDLIPDLNVDLIPDLTSDFNGRFN